jgi:hypothetical protein
LLTVLVSPNVQKRARQASEPPIISRTSIDDKRRSIPPPAAAASEVTLADGTTLPLIGGTSVAHQDRSDLEVTFAPAGRLVDALKRVERCVGQGWLGSGNSAKLYQAFFIGYRRHRINYFL